MNQRPLRTLLPILTLVTAAAVPLLAQTAPVLRVQGSAEVRIVPDLAVVRLGVAHEAQTAQAAQQAVNIASDAILDAVRRVGIDEQDVQTVRLVLSPIYSSRRPSDVSVNVRYDAGVAHFRDQFSVRSTNANNFSAGGDSGSFVWQWNSRLSPVGLLFAGGGGTTFCNRLSRVVTALDVVLNEQT